MLELLADLLVKFPHLLGGKNILKRAHLHQMLHRCKAVGGSAADPMGGRIGSQQLGELLLQVNQPVHQLVKLIITDCRIILFIIKFAVIFNLFPQLFCLLFCLLQFHPVSVPFIFNLSIKAVLPKWTKRRY